MADATRRARLIIEAKDAVTGETDKAARSLGGLKSSLSNLNQAAGSLVKSFIGPAALIGALKGSIDAAMEAQRVMTQTEAVIKSTGGAAGLTAEEIEKLAGAESRLTSIDDEVIQSGQNMLLTFTNIGSDVFPRATRAMQDMAVAFAQGDTSAIDLQGTAIQLGKALQDPERGLVALRRVGVNFTEAQKAAIKEMVAMNDVAGAQALILAELEKEFGGSAEAAGTTLAGKLQKAQNAIENLGEAIGNKLIPVLGQAADAATVLMTGGEQIDETFNKHVKDMVALLKDGTVTLKDFDAEMLRSASVAGKVSFIYDDWGNIIGENLNPEVEEQVRLAKASADSYRDLGGRMLDMAGAAEDMVGPLEETKESLDANADALKNLKGLMAGAVGNEFDDFEESQDKIREKADKLRTELDKLEAAHGRVVTSTKKNQASAEELALWQFQLGEATQGMAEIQDMSSESYLKAAVKAQSLREKIDGATGATTTFVNNSKRIGEVKAELDELDVAYADNAAAHEEATKRILFGIAEQQFAADGRIDGVEIEALNNLALHWGLVDQATADSTAAILGATMQLASDQNVDLFVEKLDNVQKSLELGMTPAAYEAIEAAKIYYGEIYKATINTADLGGASEDAIPKLDKVGGSATTAAGGATALASAAGAARDAINSIQDKEVTITTIYREQHITDLEGRTGRQFGGPVSGGRPYLVGEAGPEMFVPGAGGFVMDNADTQKMLSLLQSIATGVGGARNVTVNAGAGMDTNAIIQAIDVGLGRRARLMKSSGAFTMGT